MAERKDYMEKIRTSPIVKRFVSQDKPERFKQLDKELLDFMLKQLDLLNKENINLGGLLLIQDAKLKRARELFVEWQERHSKLEKKITG